MKPKGEIEVIGEAKAQPNDPQTEVSVLATLMRHNEKISEFSDMLTPEVVYQDRNQAI